MQASPDSEVVQRAIEGDSDAWHAVLEKYRPLLRLVAARHARRIVSHRFDESDVVQMTCVEVLRSYQGFRGETQAELEGWLESILHNNVVRLWRNHSAATRDYRREVVRDEANSGLSFLWKANTKQDPARNLVQGEVALLLAQALEQLPDEYRKTLELRFIDGKKIRDVALHLGTTVGVVAGRLRRGLECLRDLLPEELRDLISWGSE
ncbi:sigma-70 family RNA polymerase sigma factor [Blastopirellula marina]|nr:sigma-70 family RNA polymerase sigma factor [Blastopirellula marina]